MTKNNKLISTLHIPIRWVDLDAYGHVGNAKYFEYMSEARITLFGEAFTESHLHYVVADTHCVYKKPLLYPSTIILRQFLKEIGRTYMVFYYELYVAGDESKTVYAECTTKIVCFDPKKKKIVRIPDEMKINLGSTK